MSQKISCEKCGSSTKLMTVLPRFGSQPQYRLFECDTCGAVAWSADSDLRRAAATTDSAEKT